MREDVWHLWNRKYWSNFKQLWTQRNSTASRLWKSGLVLSGPFIVSRTCDVRWTERRVKVPKSTLRHHKRCWLILTAGRWPWKSGSAKECNNSPAESHSLENRLRSSVAPILGRRNKHQVTTSSRARRSCRSLWREPGWNGLWCRSWW